MMADVLETLSFVLLLASHLGAVIAIHDSDDQELFGSTRRIATGAYRHARRPRPDANPRPANAAAIHTAVQQRLA